MAILAQGQIEIFRYLHIVVCPCYMWIIGGSRSARQHGWLAACLACPYSSCCKPDSSGSASGLHRRSQALAVASSIASVNGCRRRLAHGVVPTESDARQVVQSSQCCRRRLALERSLLKAALGRICNRGLDADVAWPWSGPY